MTNDLDERLAERLKLGFVSSSDWQSYTWKNELAEQKRRIGLHLAEALADAETEHNPYHMLERAVGAASVCMRRLVERRLVTDRFRGSNLKVHEVRATTDTEWREPFLRHTAGEIFNNYDMKARHPRSLTPWDISSKMLHASVIGVLSASAYLPDGLLIASDTQRRTSLFHFTVAEITAVFDAFLDDRITRMSDGYLDDDGSHGGTGKVFTRRE